MAIPWRLCRVRHVLGARIPILTRVVFALCAAMALLAVPSAALACAPYTFSDEEDGFRLSNGIQWAFAGVVAEEIPNAELPDQPRAVALDVEETIAGSVNLGRLWIEQDMGCDGFWYRKGDRVIAAIGRLPDVRPPFVGITNYQVAVWVVAAGELVDASPATGPHWRPWVDGRAPESAKQLRTLLLAAPDTATDTIRATPSTGSPDPWTVVLPIVAAVLGLTLAARRFARQARWP
jgi:hypothetical protein